MYSWRRSSVLGDGLAHRGGSSRWVRGGSVARRRGPPGAGRTNAGPFPDRRSNCYRPLVGIVSKRRLRRGGAATTTVDHCTSPPFVHHRPYPMRRACASGRFVRRDRGPTSRLDALCGGSNDPGPVGLVAQHLERRRRAPGSSPGLAGGVADVDVGHRCPCRGSSVLSGVSHLAIVSRKPPLSSSSCVHCWTVPLPKVLRCRRASPGPRSWSAPGHDLGRRRRAAVDEEHELDVGVGRARRRARRRSRSGCPSRPAARRSARRRGTGWRSCAPP